MHARSKKRSRTSSTSRRNRDEAVTMEASMPTRSDVIRRCFAAYLNRDRKVLEDAFAEDFRFTSPYDDAIDKAAYFERCWPISASGRMANEIERIFEQGDAAF